MAKYAYEANPQLSPHFCAREFRCKCSSPHTFQVSEQLISMLERLYTALDCGKIIVSSGYRCAAHDKAVGLYTSDLCQYSMPDYGYRYVTGSHKRH